MNNRKFQYGDGFFETMIVQKGSISFWGSHLDRIMHACEVLHLDYSPHFKEVLKQEILDSSSFLNSRVRVTFWRSGEGKYTPEHNKIEYSIVTTENTIPFFRTAEKIDICTTSVVIPSVFSSFKCFLLPYVLAGIEKTKKQVDDLILLTPSGEVAECISSSVFWVKNGVFYTPSLETGCLNGTMRKQIIATLKVKNIEIQEGHYNPEDVYDADTIFCSNATGITQFKQYNRQSLQLQPLEKLFKGLEFGVIS